MGSGDSRRDLIIGAPGSGSIPGAVFVLFGGVERSGEILLSEANAIITSSEAGNRFGTSTAAGNVLSLEGASPVNLVIGAPGALGNRGAVYLMTAGFADGTSTTDASAALRILGAAGDELGTAVATADLDLDGYREMILGAPGNGRIYVIAGAPGLSGTLDLSVTAPLRTYAAPGIGGAIATGDITGDTIADVVAGAAAQNVVYVFAGGESIPVTPFATLSGIDADDEAGAAVRVVDLDGDGQQDLVMTAPGADGPVNDRANAGEAYVIFGPVAGGARSLSLANVLFIGATASMRLGDGITAGDINRDTADDLALLGSGGAAGGGQLEIYYGRGRA
ncbi:MAG TPA: FG-GAP and VCBS repeat-containing protein, partial [Vicinamibacterales bacterium]|nr:FG-GAP and VCBS repeat-containing protein [Vicinamibacterales bacterium]